MPIRILPPEIASQIAAGEVVERPASVVKELIENALDAGASHITVEIEGAGRQRIEISDDGCGISTAELRLAVERHATSKLTRAADLFHITTLGFRGEALASIGSVSVLTITSRTKDERTGSRLRVEGGLPGKFVPVGAPTGTQVWVENLFYNVPARLKFLKHDTTERHQIDSLVTRYALAYPKVRFSLQQEDRIALQTSGNGDRREILAALYGAEIARQMLAVDSQEDSLQVVGFISPTSLTRTNRREITFFVNGRPVQDTALTAALLKAYHTLLMVGRYPLAILFLEMPPDTVDVNVHPAKAEVRFREPDRIFTGVQRAARRALLAYAPAPGIAPPPVWSLPAPAPSRFPAWEPAQTAGSPAWETGSPGQSAAGDRAAGTPGDQPGESLANPQTLPGRVPLLRLIGQLASAYLIAEGPDGLYLIDQHAAHERVLFEQFVHQPPGKIASQSLLQPAVVNLPPAQSRLLTEQLDLLNKLGFQVETFGPNTFMVRAVPALLGQVEAAAALRALVEDFEEDETPLGSQLEQRLIARICKRAAVKSGKVLSVEEQRALLEGLEICQSPRTCPHGRPTMIHLPVDLLERQFGRRGAR